MTKWILIGLLCILSGCSVSFGVKREKIRYHYLERNQVQNEYLGIK